MQAMKLEGPEGAANPYRLTDDAAIPGVIVELDVVLGRDMRPTVERMTIAAPNGVTPTLLRAIPLGQALAKLNRDWDATRERAVFRFAPAAAKLDIPTSRPYPVEFYERVADVWRAALDAGIRAPGRYVAEANDVPTSTVTSWVRAARKHKFLRSTVKGRP
jgi:hypothetical protein